jgi:autotransporter adhesin
MATTTATLTLSSTGIGTDDLALTKTATLYKADSTTGLDQTTGLAKLVTEATTNVILLDTVAGPRAALGSKHGRVYIKNNSETASEYIVITINATIMGRLYAGDFAFFPWSESDAAGNIEVAPSVATQMEIEYMHIHEGITLTSA